MRSMPSGPTRPDVRSRTWSYSLIAKLSASRLIAALLIRPRHSRRQIATRKADPSSGASSAERRDDEVDEAAQLRRRLAVGSEEDVHRARRRLVSWQDA